MKVALFDFTLPPDHIALRPANPRDSARLLCVGANGQLADKSIRNLPDLCSKGDALVVNDTRVIPARLIGTRIRKPDGQARIEVTLIERLEATSWRVLLKPAKRIKKGDVIMFGEVCAHIQQCKAGEAQLQFDLSPAEMESKLAQIGTMPLPPYIATRRPPDARDKTDYQTIFATPADAHDSTHDGAIAAPTAGLHFTPELIKALAAKGVVLHRTTLHIGLGTFLPVKTEDTNDHSMHSEWGEISADTAQALNACKQQGGRLICVGSTALRLLETAADANGQIQPFCGYTNIFITPGYRFKVADRLLTNFHLPKSTLFMLVCAFSGIETMQAAYAHAIAQNYRFYSYGDACLLDRTSK